MRLCTFSTGGSTHFGAIVGDRVVDLVGAAGALGKATPAAGDLRGLIEAGTSATNAVREIVDAIDGQTDANWAWSLGDVTLHHPYRPRKNVIRAGANVRRPKANEGDGPAAVTLPPGRWLRGFPIAYYTKAPTAVLDPEQAISWPTSLTQQVYAEPQLAIVVGGVISYASPDEALENVFGYAVATDVSALDLRIRHGQWPKAGSLDTFFPWGPAIVTRDEVGDEALEITLDLNGLTVLRASTADSLLSVGEMLAEISTGIRLDPGDVLMLGVPEVIGFGQSPTRWLGAGDRVTSTVAGVGSITNPVQPVA